MIIILNSGVEKGTASFEAILRYLEPLPNIQIRTHEIQGEAQKLTELYLLGDTKRLDQEPIEALDGVERVIRISQEYRILGRHSDEN